MVSIWIRNLTLFNGVDYSPYTVEVASLPTVL
jgi:hypothetical protein